MNKEERSIRNRAYYLAHREELKEKSKARYRSNPSYYRNYSSAHRKYDKRFIGYVQNWKKRNPEKKEAHRIVLNAFRSGELRRLPCEICGNVGFAHHDNYSKPFDIRWLCRKHHAAFHRRVK